MTRSDSRRARAAQGVTAVQLAAEENARVEAIQRAKAAREHQVISYFNSRFRLSQLRGIRWLGCDPYIFIREGIEAPWHDTLQERLPSHVTWLIHPASVQLTPSQFHPTPT